MSSGTVKSLVVLLVFVLLLGGGGFLVYRHIQQKAEAKKKAVPIEKEYRYGTVKDDSEVLNAEAPQVPDMPVVVTRKPAVRPDASAEGEEEEVSFYILDQAQLAGVSYLLVTDADPETDRLLKRLLIILRDYGEEKVFAYIRARVLK